MGKTPKKAAPEGDERIRYVRRLKNASSSSSSSSSKHDDITANLTAARYVQPECENTNRGKPTTNVHKSLKSASSSKSFKSKLRSPVVKSSSSRLPKSSSGKPVSNEKEASKAGIPSKVFKHKTFAMQPKSEEQEGELESQATENVREDISVEETIDIKSKKGDTIESSDVDGEKKEEGAEADVDAKQKDDEVIQEKIAEADPEEGNTENHINQLKVQLTNEAIAQLLQDEEKEETEEHEVKLNLTMEDSPLKINLKEELNGSSEPEAVEQEPPQIPELQKENGHAAEEKDDQSEDLADTESCSVDVVESTTSEMSEASELAQIELEKPVSQCIELPSQLPKEDASFVSFDASIMLKDVQVRLNDCLKDNSQLYEVTAEELSMSEPACKDSSFGRTLRNISGRHSINRMRHVTVRSRLSPNNSLFVNMSSVSLPDEDVRDHKILRHRSGLSTTCNGTPADRKRKLEPEVSSEAKKIKTESESSLFNASIGILQGLRRPIQVSTPNVGGYKFKPDKLDISGIVTSEEKATAQEQSGAAKKWCSIM